MKNRVAIAFLLVVCALPLAGCLAGDASDAEWPGQLQTFVEEFARNALAAFLV